MMADYLVIVPDDLVSHNKELQAVVLTDTMWKFVLSCLDDETVAGYIKQQLLNFE